MKAIDVTTTTYYVASVKPPNKGFGQQNGYIHSLMSTYLEKEFDKSLSWASTKRKCVYFILSKFLRLNNHSNFVISLKKF